MWVGAGNRSAKYEKNYDGEENMSTLDAGQVELKMTKVFPVFDHQCSHLPYANTCLMCRQGLGGSENPG